jgi:hypothetical protein
MGCPYGSKRELTKPERFDDPRDRRIKMRLLKMLESNSKSSDLMRKINNGGPLTPSRRQIHDLVIAAFKFPLRFALPHISATKGISCCLN